MKAICNRNNFKEERVAGCITDVMSVAHMGSWVVNAKYFIRRLITPPGLKMQRYNFTMALNEISHP